MRQILTIVIVLAITAALATTSGATSSNRLSCADGGTTTKTGDGYRIDYCGPAVATLKIAGKTYVFRDGACFEANGNGLFLFSGTEAISNDEISNIVGGVPGPFIWIALTKQGSGIVAYNGPHPLVAGNPNKISSTSISASGRFGGQTKPVTKPISSRTTVPFNGTWHCNGPIHSWADYIANVNRPNNG